MGWFNIFSRKRPQQRPRPVARNVSTKAVRRARMTKTEPDPIFDDTGALSLEDLIDQQQGDNPYDTAAWNFDPDKGLKRVEDSKANKRRSKKTEPTNPYNSGAFRRR